MGLEPTTFAMARRRSSQLSYIRERPEYRRRRSIAAAATLSRMADAPVIRAARGTELRCRGWLQEAALRMLENNLDPDVAEDPANLVVYGGTGKAARTWDDYHRIVATLQRLGDDETLLVQSGRPAGVFRTHAMAPRVLLANSNLVPDWATWDEFRRLEALGLTMYGQMTAGSWIYIGTQGIVQGTYETFAAIARAALRRLARRPAGGHGRLRRDGRRAAPRRHDAGRRLPDRRRRSAPARRAVSRRATSTSSRPTSTRRCARPRRRGPVARAARSALVDDGQRAARVAARARRRPGHRHRPDRRPRSARRLRAGRPGPRPGGGAAGVGSGGLHPPRAAGDGAPGADDGRVAGRRRGRRRLRQQPPHRGEDGRVPAGVRLPGLRAGVRAAAVLPRDRAVPVGGAVRQPGRHRRHRRRRCASCSRRT